ncbi:VTC domain protein [Ruminiclostridium hungatei]|uniref:VTC domain protein n=1 Tax=Ruminiclostridium hungatei TaxID=48256 RepID=A0A1V4SDW5_RUMHU|nr:polyphosphate polymerase domain-containing protein [Ruminiclostridium hungatei]OPX42112.1 VTC domain protein [Ruminiclostridium hungatei]
MAITTFKRYEMKFLISIQQLNALLPRIEEYMNPDEYCKGGRNYSIYNIYYDTVDSNLIRTSLSKPLYKEKLRLRSYSPSTDLNSKVYLELKKKTLGIVHKRRAAMTLLEAYNFIEKGIKPSSKSYMGRQVIDELEYFLSKNSVSPAAYISYTRMAFFGKDDKDFRITFDSNIVTRREELHMENGSFGKQLLGGDQYLMEVKISRATPIWLARLLSELKIYKTSFSKYGTEYKRYYLETIAENSDAFSPDEEEIPAGVPARLRQTAGNQKSAVSG